MSESGTYLAIFLGSRNGPRMAAWLAQPEAERKAKEQEGMAAWKAWMEKHRADIAAMGGPLGKTKRVSGRGVEDVSNAMGGVHCRQGGVARGGRKTVREPSALCNLSGRGHRGDACSSDSGRLTQRPSHNIAIEGRGRCPTPCVCTACSDEAVDGCYLGWQQSLDDLARLVEPEINQLIDRADARWAHCRSLKCNQEG